MAVKIMTATMKSPKTASLLRRKRRQKPSSRRSRLDSIV
jgi:thymidine kinase